jgi:hypothetical protein
MELAPNSVQGKWETNFKTGMDFFIINDAIVQKICILGDDVEPCFEGASITPPEISSKFTLDNKFKRTLFNMMQDLQSALKGGQQMNELENTVAVEEAEVTPETEFTAASEEVTESNSTDLQATDPLEFTKKEEEEKKEDDTSDDDDSSDKKEDKEDKEDEAAKKYSALEQKLNELSVAYTNLLSQYQ